jgi:SOS-response transcriptional repressor LexA
MLTKRQLQLYTFLKTYSKENNIMPSFENIKTYMKMGSKSQAFQMLGYLEYKGYIKKKYAQARGIKIIKEYKCE